MQFDATYSADYYAALGTRPQRRAEPVGDGAPGPMGWLFVFCAVLLPAAPNVALGVLALGLSVWLGGRRLTGEATG